MLSQGLAGRRKRPFCDQNTLVFFFLFLFFILPYFSMAEPYHDTSSFPINVVLASHQSKHSYALLQFIYTYIMCLLP